MTRIINLSVTLLLLFGITYLSFSLGSEVPEGGELAVLVGFVLLAASVAGSLASSMGLPRLTGFLLVGIVAGPSVLSLIPSESLDQLRLIDEFALALIAMLAGGELKVEALRPQAKSIAAITLFITVIVWVLLAGVILTLRPLLPFLTEEPWTVTVGIALLLGVWAANSSPDLTVAVIEEEKARGPLVDVILGVTIVKDVLVIVLFTLTLALVEPLIDGGASGLSGGVLLDLTREVGGALVVGGALGWLFSLYLGDGKGRERPPMATFLFTYLLVVTADRLHVELLLAAVAAGFVIENLSPAGDRMIRGIESVSVVIFAFFFTIAGASLDLGSIGQFWIAALILFGARLLFTFLGARIGGRLAGTEPFVQERAWRGLISQGGVTLGLVLLIEQSFPELGPEVVALGMAVIIGNILGGPILLKQALAGASKEVVSEENE